MYPFGHFIKAKVINKYLFENKLIQIVEILRLNVLLKGG